jgi:hypothetical protein
MEVLEKLFPIKLYRMKKYQLFKYIFDLKLLKEPSIDMFQFFRSYNFINLLSIRNQLILLYNFHLKVNLNSLNLYAKWEFHKNANNAYLLQCLMRISFYLTNLIKLNFEVLTIVSLSCNIRV